MKKTLKIFEKRKEIVNKLKDEAKADIIKFLLENPFNTIDFTSNTTARGKYHREKIGNSITEDDLTNEELKEVRQEEIRNSHIKRIEETGYVF